MDYEKKYKEALEMARNLHKDAIDMEESLLAKQCEIIFPELRESEDEKIRKALIDFFNRGAENGAQTNGVCDKDILAWLEKQAQTFTKKDVDDAYLKGVCDAKQELENQCEQKSIWHNEDEEPKRDNLILLIMQSGTPIVAKIIEPNHTFEHGERWAYIDDLLEKQGSDFRYPTTYDKAETSITTMKAMRKQGKEKAINDTGEDIVEAVKDTSILDILEPNFNFKVGQWIVATGKRVYLITKIDGFNVTLVDIDGNEYVFDTSSLDDAHLWTIQDAKLGDVLVSQYSNPFIYNGNRDSFNVGSYCGISVDDRFNVSTGKCHWTENVSIHPATKEQRDLLFQKMGEAHYEWDAKEKKLKKIHIIDEGKAEMDYCFTKMMNGEKVSPAWSEEDELSLKQAIYVCHQNGYTAVENWLKSIKQRIGG